MSPFRLLREPRFGPFFFTQFFGAFNDNLFKSALLIYVAFRLSDSGTLVNVAQALFILPFFLFSSIAGQLADKVEKSHLIRQIKAAEIGIMVVAAIALALGDVAFLLGLLFCMGVQSAFFGPVKYAILPQTLRDDELVGGNGMIEMGTFLAILLGTLAGGPLIASTYGAYLVGGTVVTVALAGWFTSARIPPCPSVDPGLRIGWNLIGDSWRIIQTARKRRTVFNSILGISWFWAFGAILLAQLPAYTKTTLGGDELVVTHTLVLKGARIRAPVRASGAQCVHLV